MTKDEFMVLSGGLNQSQVWEILANKDGQPARVTIHMWAHGRKRTATAEKRVGQQEDFMRLILRGVCNRHLWWSTTDQLTIEEIRHAGVKYADLLELKGRTFEHWMKSRPNVARAMVWGLVE